MKNKKESAGKTARNCGIISLVISVPLTVLFGWIPGVAGLFAGIISIIVGVTTRRKTSKRKGMSGIVMGFISALFAACFVALFLVFPDKISENAANKGFPLIAEHVGAMKYGVVGFMIEINSEKDADYYLEQLDSIKKNR
ncbi:MAG: hypothetical protein J5819_04555 [Eubacterium sp.]|nr:hypothetical protein [Eubacterium sp.]